MWDGYADVPITSRAAEAELERQRARLGRKTADAEAGAHAPPRTRAEPREVQEVPAPGIEEHGL